MSEYQYRVLEFINNGILGDILKFTGNILSSHTGWLFLLYNYHYILIIIIIAFGAILSYDMKYRGTLKIHDYFSESFASIMENKGRSLFSIFGLSIGIASLTGILGIGQSSGGLTYYETEIAGKEKTSYIFSLMPEKKQASLHFRNPLALNMEDIVSLKEDCFEIMRIVPYIEAGRVEVKTSEKKAEASITGTTWDHKFMLPLEWGRIFTPEEVRNCERLCLITGDDFKKELFGNIDPKDKYIKIKDRSFRIIGVIDPLELQWHIIIPLSILIKEEKIMGFDRLIIETYPGTNSHRFRNKISKSIQKNHNLKTFILEQKREFIPGKTWEEEKKEEISLTPIQVIMGVIAFISLLIGGIGIMNVMLISVSQRTREIGVRRALGAKQSDILSQFLLESIFLSIIGGILGLILGVLGTSAMVYVFNKYGLNVIFSFNLKNNLLLSLLFSMCVGVLFGEYPARKASQLDPIDCLRHS